jgi:hypothetical protein
MLTIFRRHTHACKAAHDGKDLGRKFRKCDCPIHAEGILRGAKCRHALDTRDWDAALVILGEVEMRGTWDQPNAQITDANGPKPFPHAMKFYTPKQVGALLKVRTSIITGLIDRKQLGTVLIEGTHRVPEAALRSYLGTVVQTAVPLTNPPQTHPPTPQPPEPPPMAECPHCNTPIPPGTSFTSHVRPYGPRLIRRRPKASDESQGSLDDPIEPLSP